MTTKSLRALVTHLAEQQYRFHLLVVLLVEKGILKQGELNVRFDASSEKIEFAADFLKYLQAIGLEIE